MFLTGLMRDHGLTLSHEEKLVAESLVFLVVPVLPTIDLPGTTTANQGPATTARPA
jgi:hypothetical protein